MLRNYFNQLIKCWLVLSVVVLLMVSLIWGYVSSIGYLKMQSKQQLEMLSGAVVSIEQLSLSLVPMGFNLESVRVSNQQTDIAIEQIALRINLYNLLLRRWSFTEILVQGVENLSPNLPQQDAILPRSAQHALQQEDLKTLPRIQAIEQNIRSAQQLVAELSNGSSVKHYQERVIVLTGLSAMERSDLKQLFKQRIQNVNKQQQAIQQINQQLLQDLRQLPNLPSHDLQVLTKKYKLKVLHQRFANLALGDLVRQRLYAWQGLYCQYQPLLNSLVKMANSAPAFRVDRLSIDSLAGNEELMLQPINWLDKTSFLLKGEYSVEGFSTLTFRIDLVSGHTQLSMNAPKRLLKNVVIVDSDYVSLVTEQAEFSERMVLTIMMDGRMQGNWQQHYQSIRWNESAQPTAVINRLRPDFLKNSNAFELTIHLRGSIINPNISINSNLDSSMYRVIHSSLQDFKQQFEFDVNQLFNVKVVAAIQAIRQQLQQLNRENKRFVAEKQTWQELLHKIP